MDRRTFLAAAAGLSLPALGAPTSIIDTHTHFYDPARPQGVPWPQKSDKILYRTVMPEEFVRMTKPLGVTGTIAVEASPLLDDNQWILDVAAREPVIVATVGHLEPGKPAFRQNLARFQKNPLFRGIRVAQFSGLADAQFVSDLKAVSDAGLEMDAIGPPRVLEEVVRLTDLVHNLRIVIDHMPFAAPVDRAVLREIGKRPQVYAKVSNVPRPSGDPRPGLDELWEIFGSDRLIYGSNWPVSDKVAPYDVALKIVREYFGARGPEVSEKFFRENSKTAYRWIAR